VRWWPPRSPTLCRRSALPVEDLESVFSTAPLGIYVDHPERGCIYANGELLRMFGATFEEFAGFGWARRVHEDDAEALRDAIHEYEHELVWPRARPDPRA